MEVFFSLPQTSQAEVNLVHFGPSLPVIRFALVGVNLPTLSAHADETYSPRLEPVKSDRAYHPFATDQADELVNQNPSVISHH